MYSNQRKLGILDMSFSRNISDIFLYTNKQTCIAANHVSKWLSVVLVLTIGIFVGNVARKLPE